MNKIISYIASHKIIHYYTIGVVVLILCGGIFYWFQYRPTVVRKKCTAWAVAQAQDLAKSKAKMDSATSAYEYEQIVKNGMYFKNDYDYAYTQCLRTAGMDK